MKDQLSSSMDHSQLHSRVTGTIIEICILYKIQGTFNEL
jgi:hypothetical protein